MPGIKDPHAAEGHREVGGEGLIRDYQVPVSCLRVSRKKKTRDLGDSGNILGDMIRVAIGRLRDHRKQERSKSGRGPRKGRNPINCNQSRGRGGSRCRRKGLSAVGGV